LMARGLAPAVSLRLWRQQGGMPVVTAEGREAPAARPADGGALPAGAIERAGIELVAFVALRLDAAKEPGRLEVLEGFVRKPTEMLGMDGALAQHREQRADTAKIIVRRHISWCMGTRARRRLHRRSARQWAPWCARTHIYQHP